MMKRQQLCFGNRIKHIITNRALWVSLSLWASEVLMALCRFNRFLTHFIQQIPIKVSFFFLECIAHSACLAQGPVFTYHCSKDFWVSYILCRKYKYQLVTCFSEIIFENILCSLRKRVCFDLKSYNSCRDVFFCFSIHCTNLLFSWQSGHHHHLHSNVIFLTFHPSSLQ